MEEVDNNKNKILSAQAKQLFSNSYSAGWANITAALTFYLLVVMQSQVSTFATLWFLMLVTIAVVRMVLGLRFMDDTSEENVTSRLRQYFVVILLLGICWGGISIMQLQLGDADVRNYSFLIFLGVVAASVITLSSWRPLFAAFALPQLIIIVVVMVVEGRIVSYYSALGMMVFTALMLALSKKIHAGLIDTLTLKVVNLELIDELSVEVAQRRKVQQELESHQLELERAVRERTHALLEINENLKREIEERELAEENLRYVEQYDQLTGLPNRGLLLDRIRHAISASAREKWIVAVLFLGIDGFKRVNDSLGHAVGDNLLQQAAARMALLLREADTVARNGGDEFVVVLEHIEKATVAEVVARKIISSLNDTFNIVGHDIHIGVTVGIAIFPFDGEGPQHLLESADTAMHRAKQLGGNNYQFYAEGMSREIRERVDMENRLRFAVELGELFMVYQPQVNSMSGKTVGFEALIRWHNPELGFVGPDKFIPLLEESGMIYSVGEWIIRDVVRFVQSGEAQGRRVSINLSARQCSQIGLGDFIQKIVREYGIDPAQLEFELTESMLLDDFKRATSLINQLQGMGCTIALDDFGIGYTSMSYLARLNINVIKIDRSFVTGIDNDESLRKIVYAIIGMSQSLDIENVIEGVERAEELATVQTLGGRIIQGYLYSKPLKQGEELSRWLAEN